MGKWDRKLLSNVASVLCAVGVITTFLGCQAPSPRLEAYVGTAVGPEGMAALQAQPSPTTPLETGLLVINDTKAPGSAPALSAKALVALEDEVKAKIERAVPVRVVKVLSLRKLLPSGESKQFAQLAQEQGFPFLVVAIFSSAESDVPARLSLGGPEAVAVSGYYVQNYALAELAFLEATTGRALVRIEGRSWATLEGLTVPVQSNQYPVIRRSVHGAPIFTSEEGARDAVRFVAAEDALRQALMHLKTAWARTFPAASS